MQAAFAHRFAVLPKSPLDNVASTAWFRFLTLMEMHPASHVSSTGSLGAYEMQPRRLVELGYLTNVRREDNGKKQVGTFVLPWTEEKFLGNRFAQYVAFKKSILLYYRDLMSGKIERPKGVSMAGALTILHKGGKGALKAFPELFEDTQKLYDRVKDAF